MTIEYQMHDLYPESIVIRNFTGKVGAIEIIDSWKYLIENQIITKAVKGVINNLTNCELTMNLESFQILISYMKNQEALKRIKIAAISDTPQKTVFPILGGMESRELEIIPFSTLEAAVSWIMFDF